MISHTKDFPESKFPVNQLCGAFAHNLQSCRTYPSSRSLDKGHVDEGRADRPPPVFRNGGDRIKSDEVGAVYANKRSDRMAAIEGEKKLLRPVLPILDGLATHEISPPFELGVIRAEE